MNPWTSRLSTGRFLAQVGACLEEGHVPNPTLWMCTRQWYHNILPCFTPFKSFQSHSIFVMYDYVTYVCIDLLCLCVCVRVRAHVLCYPDLILPFLQWILPPDLAILCRKDQEHRPDSSSALTLHPGIMVLATSSCSAQAMDDHRGTSSWAS